MKLHDHAQTVERITSRFTVFVAAVSAVLIGCSAALAYGPERPTYTTQNAAPHITFNSITNNASYGDERDFMNIKDASITTSGEWQNTLKVENGKEYWVRVLVHNNAKPQLNLVAKNTRVAVSVSNKFASKITLDGFVRADNATPQEVWDNAVMTSDKKFNIAYVAGSARYYNNIKPTGDGFKLSDDIVTNTGALVGYESMNGDVKGCYEYSGYAIFKVKVTMSSPNFSVEKSVRINGTDKWHKNITAKPGQKVDYEIAYDNTGSATQSNVIAQDTLPKGVKYVAGSTTVKNATNPNGNGLKITSDNIVKPLGINIGNYGPNGNAYVRFSAVLPSNEELENCGPNKLVNIGKIATQNGEKTDTAVVTVNKTDCVEELPTTGPVEVIAGLVGIAAITVGIVYYVKSRRELDKALLDAQTNTTLSKNAPKSPLKEAADAIKKAHKID